MLGIWVGVKQVAWPLLLVRLVYVVLSMMIEGVALPIPPCAQEAIAAAAALPAIVVGVGVLPVESRERTSMTWDKTIYHAPEG